MQIIAVDIGNSAIKFLVGRSFLRLEDRPIKKSLPPYHAILNSSLPVDFSKNVSWVVSSVSGVKLKHLEDWVKQSRPSDRLFVITHGDVPLDVIESYRDKVGIDRLLAAYAAVFDARERLSANPLIVIDAGTAVTVDLVTASKNGKRVFEGGFIFPGAESSLRALYRSTDDLPELAWLSVNKILMHGTSEDGNESLIGTNTQEAISYGVHLSQAHAVSGTVAELKKRAPDAEVYITGGGASNILKQLENKTTVDWHVDSELVPHGVMLVGRELLSNENTD